MPDCCSLLDVINKHAYGYPMKRFRTICRSKGLILLVLAAVNVLALHQTACAAVMAEDRPAGVEASKTTGHCHGSTRREDKPAPASDGACCLQLMDRPLSGSAQPAVEPGKEIVIWVAPEVLMAVSVSLPVRLGNVKDPPRLSGLPLRDVFAVRLN